MKFPKVRPRRLRRDKIIRDMVADTKLSLDDFIVPIFVDENLRRPRPIESLPGQYRYPIEGLTDYIEKLLELGLNKIIIFGIPREKDEYGSQAYDKNGVVQRSLRAIKEVFSNKLLVFTDVCLCQYTSHGHCGVISQKVTGGVKSIVIDNDPSLEYLAKTALSHAEAGADFVAPSNMMDGVVGAIRDILDREGFNDVGIMSYTVKYASYFYGPFREAAESAPRFGDRRTYQMDPRLRNEMIKEVILDIEEGADIVMVKPALAYLDVIHRVKTSYPWIPLAAYNVSGEYLMVKSAAKEGWIDEFGVTLEVLYSIKRAGADIILTYHAVEIAENWDSIKEYF